MKSIRITIQMEPIAKGRARVTLQQGHFRTYTPERTKAAEDFLRARLLKHRGDAFPAHTPVRLSVTFYRTKSKYLPKYETMPYRKWDLDNAVKWVLDCLNEILVPDDAAITTLRAAKRWSSTGKGYITLKLEDDEA